MNEPAVKIKSLTRAFGEREVIRNCSMTVEKGGVAEMTEQGFEKAFEHSAERFRMVAVDPSRCDCFFNIFLCPMAFFILKFLGSGKDRSR
jgi:hypothetical protein